MAVSHDRPVPKHHTWKATEIGIDISACSCSNVLNEHASYSFTTTWPTSLVASINVRMTLMHADQAGLADVHGRNIDATSSNITSIELGRATAADIRAAFKEHQGTEMPMEVPSGSLSVVVGSDTESVSRRCFFLVASAIVVSSCFSQRCVILQRP